MTEELTMPGRNYVVLELGRARHEPTEPEVANVLGEYPGRTPEEAIGAAVQAQDSPGSRYVAVAARHWGPVVQVGVSHKRVLNVGNRTIELPAEPRPDEQ